MAQSAHPVPNRTLTEWHSPHTRTDAISDLIHGVDRYNPTNLSEMEDYLSAQLRAGEHDLLANLAILKLYQFNPQLSNPDVIVNILLKSLSATVHGPDFNLCLSLLREPINILHDIDSDDQSFVIMVPFIQKLHELIRTCQFTTFWKEFNSSTDVASRIHGVYLPQQPHLLTDLRHLFATSIASCFSRIPLVRIQRWLDLPQSELGDWCAGVGWQVEGEMAVIPKNGDNDVKAGVVKETVELNQLTKLVAAAAY
ncbi:MAG: hypothetical protein TREMPRED_003078 [Tremellales sp. Tagirdzhanova-0007]|nr:MAG: hypothetical protein TREMPRED_003078 [Tremellales sp. Tagirdzhanova-0007]